MLSDIVTNLLDAIQPMRGIGRDPIAEEVKG